MNKKKYLSILTSLRKTGIPKKKIKEYIIGLIVIVAIAQPYFLSRIVGVQDSPYKMWWIGVFIEIIAGIGLYLPYLFGIAFLETIEK